MSDNLEELKDAIADYLVNMQHEVMVGKDFLTRHPSQSNSEYLSRAKSNLEIAKEMNFLLKDLVPMVDESDSDV